MNRIGFWAVTSGLCLALAGCGGDPCGDARSQIAETCGEDFDTSDFESACGNTFVDGDACKSCIATALEAGDAACGTLMTTCRTECYCPLGVICTADSGPADAGMPDSEVVGPSCGSTGGMAGQCRMGTACATGLQCAAEFGPNLPGGTTPSTLGSLYGFNAGMADPDHEGEFLSTGEESTVPVNFAPGDPGGQCTRGCSFPSNAMPDDGCGSCASCSNTLGGSPTFGLLGAAGLAVEVTTSGGVQIVDFDTQDGVCRLNCAFDPATNGGCSPGYTCDPGTNVCVEACISDVQCNAEFGLSRAEGYVVGEVMGTPYTCNTTTGRCEYEPPAGAGLNTPCETNLDCPEFGICLIGGHCGTLACVDSTNMMAGPGFDCMGAGGQCFNNGGNNGSICLPPCESPDDCFAGQACTGLGVDGAEPFVCIGFCNADSECHGDERCHEVRADDASTAGTDESLSVCEATCDPDPVAPDVTGCEDDQICEPVEGEEHGFCVFVNQLCGADADCNGDQACEILGTDSLGRCVDGCRADADCDDGQLCRRQAVTQDDESDDCSDDDDCETEGEGCHVDGYCSPLNEVGVCRAPGGACASSDVFNDGSDRQPWSGNEQCVPGQTCNAVAATIAAPEGQPGVCVGGDFPDGGMPTDGGTATDGGTGSDAGSDGGTPETDGGFTILPDGALIPLDAGLPL